MLKGLPSLAVLMVALPVFARAPTREPVQVSGWSSSGPSFPVADAIATPSDLDGLVYTGARNGDATQSALFQSGDAGASWVSLANAPAGETITAVAIDPRSPLNMIAETRRADQAATLLYRSPNRGANWYLHRVRRPPFPKR